MSGKDTIEMLPPGCPAWVTADLLADTIETWQPYYTNRLTVTDGLEILLGVSRLFDATLSRQEAT